MTGVQTCALPISGKMTPSFSARKFLLKNGGAHFPCVFSVQTTHFHLVISKIRFEIFRNGNVSFGPIEYGEKDTLGFGPEIFRSETEGVIFPAFYRSKPPMAAPGLLGPGPARRFGRFTVVIPRMCGKVGTHSRNPHASWLRTHVFLQGLGGIDIGPKSWHSPSQSARAGPRSWPFYHGNIDIDPKRWHSRSQSAHL